MPALTRLEFGALLKAARVQKGLIQAKLAKETGVPLWAIAQAETGRAVGQDNLDKLCDYLGIPRTKKFAQPTPQEKPKKAEVVEKAEKAEEADKPKVVKAKDIDPYTPIGLWSDLYTNIATALKNFTGYEWVTFEDAQKADQAYGFNEYLGNPKSPSFEAFAKEYKLGQFADPPAPIQLEPEQPQAAAPEPPAKLASTLGEAIDFLIEAANKAGPYGPEALKFLTIYLKDKKT